MTMRSPALWLAVCATVAVPSVMHAQEATSPGSEPSCLRYTFGTWTPALDWKAAGHTTTLDSSKVERAPGGRSWAAPGVGGSGDTILVLYPPFWPVGVALAFDPRTLAPGDTANVTATAFVADAAVPRPVARARVWRVHCR